MAPRVNKKKVTHPPKKRRKLSGRTVTSETRIPEKRQLEVNAGNEALALELPVVRELLSEAIRDLTVIDDTIALAHIVLESLTQTLLDHDVIEVAPLLHSTPEGLLVIHDARLQRVAHLRAVMAAHNKLPPDILAKIFTDACDGQPLSLPPDESTTLWSIIQVCRKWRHVSLNERRLWTDLTLTVPRFCGLHFPDRMRDIFARNTGIPICFHVDGMEYSYCHGDSTPITDLVVPNLRLFRVLNLELHSVGFSPLFESPSGSVDLLESVTLHMQWCLAQLDDDLHPFKKDKPIKVFSKAPSLREFKISSMFVHGMWLSLRPDVLDLPWKQLTRIQFGPACGISSSDAHKILRQSNQLVHFHSDLIAPLGDSVPVGCPIVCHNLQSFSVFSIGGGSIASFLQPLVLPSLINFSYGSRGSSLDQLELISLIRRSACSIMTLKVSQGGNWNPETIAEELLEELPSLTDLRVFLTFPVPILKKISCGQLLPKVECLEFHVDPPGSFVDILESRATASSVGGEIPGPGFRVTKAICGVYTASSLYDAALERLGGLKRLEGESITLERATYVYR